MFSNMFGLQQKLIALRYRWDTSIHCFSSNFDEFFEWRRMATERVDIILCQCVDFQRDFSLYVHVPAKTGGKPFDLIAVRDDCALEGSVAKQSAEI